jgi:hypothetical protein
VNDTNARRLHVAEVALRTFAKSATGPGDRPQSLALLLAEYDRRGDRVRDLEAVQARAVRAARQLNSAMYHVRIPGSAGGDVLVALAEMCAALALNTVPASRDACCRRQAAPSHTIPG